MKNLLVASVVTLVSFNAAAKMDAVKFKGEDSSFETQVCVVAAEQGLAGVRALTNELGLDYQQVKHSTICNFTSLTRFAAKYQAAEEPVEEQVKLVAADKEATTKACVTAAEQGLVAARAQFGDLQNLFCNGKTISRFARQYN